MNRIRDWSFLKKVRQGVQILALLFYGYLMVMALQQRIAFPLADLFFRLDPLVAVTAMIASRRWLARLALAGITILLTLVFGRVWCGWLCPLGTLLEWTRFKSARSYSKWFSPRWRSIKNVLLLLILVAALFGNLSLLIFDPITILTRTVTTAVLPTLNQTVTAVERFVYPAAPFRFLVNWTERLFRGTVLPVKQPIFAQGLFIALLFIAIVAANILADRFWCRYLCPLGALLGWLSKISLLRPIIGPACNRCGNCAGACRLDAIDTRQGYEILAGECTVCLDCLSACPTNGIGFRSRDLGQKKRQWRPDPVREFDPSRRQILSALAFGAVGVALLQTESSSQQLAPHLIRPPGVVDEDAFLARCVRCSQCIKVCPTAGLQPVLLEAGARAVWTPQLISRLGNCDYGCNACGQICPSGAIPSLPLDIKRLTKMGMAVVNRDRCWPWAFGIPCIVCEEMCPIPHKAIHLIQDPDTGLQKPVVSSAVCIGCGLCEQQCPVEGEAAIRIVRG